MASILLNKNISEESGRFRLKVYVSETSDNLPGSIFLFHNAPITSTTSVVFEKVCLYADLLNYPENAVEADTTYFRRSYVDRLFDSYTQADEFWTALKASTLLLLDDIVVNNTATPVTETYSYA